MNPIKKRALKASLITPVIILSALLFGKLFPSLFLIILTILGIIIAYPFLIHNQLNQAKELILNQNYSIVIDGIIIDKNTVDTNGLITDTYKVTMIDHAKSTVYLKTLRY